MPKKLRKAKIRKKRQNIPSIQTPENVAPKTYAATAPFPKISSPKSSAATKAMPDYKYVYTEIKVIGILFVIIMFAIVILWLILR